MDNMNWIDWDSFRGRYNKYEEEYLRLKDLEQEVNSLSDAYERLCKEARIYQDLKDELSRLERRCRELESEIDALNDESARHEEEGRKLDEEIARWKVKIAELQKELEDGDADERQNGTLLKKLKMEMKKEENELEKHRAQLKELEDMIARGRSLENIWAGLSRDGRVLQARWKTTKQMLDAGGQLVEQGHLDELVDKKDEEALKMLGLMVANDDAFWRGEK